MSEGTIKFSCDCGKAYKVPDKFAGKRVRCKQCGETVAVPSASEPIASSRAAAVTQRSLIASKRLASRDRDEDEDEPEAPAKKKPSARVATKPAPPRPAAPVRRPGGDTQVVELADLTPELKRYQRKKDEDLSKGTGKLVLFGEGKPVKSFRLDKEPKTLGRGPTCSFQLEDKSVSKAHVRFEYMMGMFIATDTGSTNGLVVNGKKVRRASMKDGDVLQLGSVVMRIDVGK